MEFRCGTRCRGTSLCPIREKPCLPMKSHVIVSETNDLTDCAVHHHRSSPQHSAPWNAMPSGEIPPSGQDDMEVR
jgi:hypothetical protein